ARTGSCVIPATTETGSVTVQAAANSSNKRGCCCRRRTMGEARMARPPPSNGPNSQGSGASIETADAKPNETPSATQYAKTFTGLVPHPQRYCNGQLTSAVVLLIPSALDGAERR